jgi:tetratricopeptide (TPR) repeat protein
MRSPPRSSVCWSWRRRGGKGPLEPTGSRWTPIDQIYSDPRVRIVALSSDLSEPEQARVRSRFPREVAEQIIKHGIGEYFVAAPVLVRKLDEERHASDEWPCPEGAAVVWAAIDWSRSGMMRPVPRSLLQKLWGHYLHDGQAIDERFDRALAWALAPAYRSIALLHENDGYQTYDWLLAYADDRRDIDAAVWNAILSLADPGDAMNIAAAAHARGDDERSKRALEVAKRSGDSNLAAFASLLLGEVFERQRHYRQSDAAYRRAFKSGHPDVAAMAAMSLGESLKRRGDTKGARVAFEKAIEQRHSFVSAMAAETLGRLLRNEGDLVGARVAFERAIESEHPDAAPLAQYRLGELLAQEGDTEGARVAFEPALQSGHPEAAPLAQYRLGGLLADEGAPEARAAFERAAESGHPYAGPMAGNDLGSWLRDNGDLDGARPWLERAIRSGHAEAAPMAAYNLGLVLQQQGDLEGARASYQRAADSDHSDAAAQATCNLGSIRVQQGDLPGAIPFLRRAVASGHSEAVAKAAITLGEVLAHQGDVKGARAAYRKAEESGRPDQAAKARKGLERLLAKPTPLVAQPHPRATTGGTWPTFHGPASARGAKPEQDAHQPQDSPKAPKHNSSGGTSADGSDTGRSNNR